RERQVGGFRVTSLPTPTPGRREADRRPRSASRVPGVLAFLTLILAAALAPSGARAEQPGFAFLEIPTGARAAALGGAYASMSEGVASVFWNAAGLSEAQGFQIVGGHAEMIERLRTDHFALGGRAWGGGIAASVRALYTDPIEERDELGNLIGSFGAHDLEF